MYFIVKSVQGTITEWWKVLQQAIFLLLIPISTESSLTYGQIEGVKTLVESNTWIFWIWCTTLVLAMRWLRVTRCSGRLFLALYNQLPCCLPLLRSLKSSSRLDAVVQLGCWITVARLYLPTQVASIFTATWSTVLSTVAEIRFSATASFSVCYTNFAKSIINTGLSTRLLDRKLNAFSFGNYFKCGLKRVDQVLDAPCTAITCSTASLPTIQNPSRSLSLAGNTALSRTWLMRLIISSPICFGVYHLIFDAKTSWISLFIVLPSATLSLEEFVSFFFWMWAFCVQSPFPGAWTYLHSWFQSFVITDIW